MLRHACTSAQGQPGIHYWVSALDSRSPIAVGDKFRGNDLSQLSPPILAWINEPPHQSTRFVRPWKRFPGYPDRWLPAYHIITFFFVYCSFVFSIIFLFTLPGLGKQLPGPPPAKKYGRFLQPTRNQVIRGNIVKVAIPPIIGTDTIQQATFRVRYSGLISNKMERAICDTLIGTDSMPPFEVLWDCSKVPDQGMTNIKLYCSVTTATGERKGGPGIFSTGIVLDRNPLLLKKAVVARKANDPVTVDGLGEDWDRPAGMDFANNDNHIFVKSQWDNQFLYFLIRVRDSAVYPAETDKLGKDDREYLRDGVEIFIDAAHDHNEVRSGDDFQVMATADGKVRGLVWGSSRQGAKPKARPRFNPKVAVQRSTKGYVVETALAWVELGVAPRPGLQVGFNLVNTDREEKHGVVVTASWAGISDLLHHNPSEWGNLVLRSSTGREWGLASILAALALLTAIVIGQTIRSRRKANSIPESSPTNQELAVALAKEYLAKNFMDDSLGLKTVSSHVNLSPDYFRQIFKKTTGLKFATYLNQLRVDKSKEMLATTNKRVSEIAFDVGFGTLQNFNRAFKKGVGTSPGEYRKKNFTP